LIAPVQDAGRAVVECELSRVVETGNRHRKQRSLVCPVSNLPALVRPPTSDRPFAGPNARATRGRSNLGDSDSAFEHTRFHDQGGLGRVTGSELTHEVLAPAVDTRIAQRAGMARTHGERMRKPRVSAFRGCIGGFNHRRIGRIMVTPCGNEHAHGSLSPKRYGQTHLQTPRFAA
jgi:hypothetical protein